MTDSAGKRILLPLSWLYGLITDGRNALYDQAVLKTVKPPVCSISVGNLAVGGTGKTPMVEFLIKWYVDQYGDQPPALATLSRGYGRKTKGFWPATPADTAETIGDEPLQLYRKFGRQVQIFVGERRAEALQQIARLHPETRLVLLDDAFQHRAVSPQISLLLTDVNRPFYVDAPFPAGRLRERRSGARRADAVVVTKCPLTLPAAEQQRIRAQIDQYTRPGTPVFFARLRYELPRPFAAGDQTTRLTAVVLVSGLANADPLEQYVAQTFRLLRHVRFADHHPYTRTELDDMLTGLPAGAVLLTTEKDWVKLDALLTPDERETLPLFYLPVGMQLLAGSDEPFRRYLTDALVKKC